ncbi:hypothetical protein [Agarivorans sp. OAG1]|uniref:hypothetical protein n=1 Tax=Agarivorans sp. OAG1 TaxID=3082387 RepID=UPI0030CB2203
MQRQSITFFRNGTVKLNTKNIHLETFLFILGVTWSFGNVLTIINPAFDSVDTNVFWISNLAFVFISMFSFYFKAKRKLGIIYLLWQAFLFLFAVWIIYDINARIWISTHDDYSIIILSLLFNLLLFSLSFTIKVFDPASNFIQSINAKRFKKGRFTFNPYAHLSNIASTDNPFLKKIGWKPNNESNNFADNVRKGGSGTAILTPLGIMLKLYNLEELFLLILLTGGVACFSYMAANNFFVDLYYCLRAGFRMK